MTTEIIIGTIVITLTLIITIYTVIKALREEVIVDNQTELDTALLFLIEDKAIKMIEDLSLSNCEANLKIINNLISHQQRLINTKLKNTWHYKYHINLFKLRDNKYNKLFRKRIN